MPPTTLIISTRNRHKVEEIQSILSDRYSYLTLHDLAGAPSVIEDAPDFAGNAAKKAADLARWLKAQPAASVWVAVSSAAVLADDSGLEVDALNGAPGVHSARFAAFDGDSERAAQQGNSPDAANNAKLLRLLRDIPVENRGARFRCVIALVELNRNSALAAPRLFDGTCEGRISFSPGGGGGFGYDPLFVPAGYSQSFAELGEGVKNSISHRAKALAKLREWLEREL